jgi:hypothetical protein
MEPLAPVTFERHLQTIIVVIIVSLLGWVGITVQQTQVAVAQLTVEVAYLKEAAAKPAEKFKDIEKRLDRIEARLANLD